MIIEVPYWRGRRVSLHGYARDDNRSPREYQEALVQAARHGESPPRRERMPHRSWWLSASLTRRASPEYGASGMPVAWLQKATKEAEEASERYVGTIMKGWFRLGWSRYRFKTVAVEVAAGGEDGMLQAAFRSPVVSAALGVRVPRQLLASWVYQRRVWQVHLGYIGSLARVEFAFDDAMDNMGDYYQRQRDSRLTRAQMWKGWGCYVGGTSVWEKQVLSRIFGRRVYARELGEREAVLVVMPEGVYDAQVRTSVETWKRARLRSGKALCGVEIELDDPPMFAGKGENSWDCDDDAIYSLTVRRCTDAREAARYYRDQVMEMRERYGQPRVHV